MWGSWTGSSSRFDLVLDFPVPTRAQINAFARSRTIALGGRADRALANALRAARSYADAERIVMDVHRRRILSQEME